MRKVTTVMGGMMLGVLFVGSYYELFTTATPGPMQLGIALAVGFVAGIILVWTE